MLGGGTTHVHQIGSEVPQCQTSNGHSTNRSNGDNGHAKLELSKPIASTAGELQQRDIQFPFPYPNPWNIQYDFMRTLYDCIENGKIGIFESPTGTGKSLSLICGSLKWLMDHEQRSDEQRLEDLIAVKLKEPDWVKEHRMKKIRSDALFDIESEKRRREKVKEKLARIRDEERVLGFGRNRKQPKKSPKSKAPDDEDDDALIVDDYYSGDERSGGKNSEKRIKPSKFDSYDESEEKEDDNEEIDELKIYYCSRTHSQLSQFIGELKKTEHSEWIKSVSLGSRKNLCINDSVNRLSSMIRINDKCLDMQKEGNSSCQFFPKEKRLLQDFTDRTNAIVGDIEDLVGLGKSLGCCPYYGTRNSVPSSQIVTLPYNMMLQKSTRESLGIKLKNNIVIFDEAHNMIDTITGIHSVTLELQEISRAQELVNMYLEKYLNRLKGKNIAYIKQLLILLGALKAKLTKALESKPKPGAAKGKLMIATNQDTGFRTATDFLNDLQVHQINLFKIRTYLTESRLSQKLQGFAERKDKKESKQKKGAPSTSRSEVPVQGKIIRCVKVLFNQVLADNEFVPKHVPILQKVESFLGSLLNVNLDGRVGVVYDENDSKTCFKYLLLNPSDVFKEIIDEARAVILAGGTMEPVDEFQDQLMHHVDNEKVVRFSCGHIVPPTSILTLSLSVGPSGMPLNFTFDNRLKDSMVNELGNTIASICELVPAGVVCFFGSYGYMEAIVEKWRKSKILGRIEKSKKIFSEPRNASTVDACLQEYAQIISQIRDNGGLAVSKQRIARIDGKNEVYRCKVTGKLQFIELHHFCLDLVSKSKKKSADYYENICMRSLNQSIGK
ncbi:DEAD H (Asp-Glu-Ala-Asp His) box helicase 11 [Blyttiomyces sp. JEL0837]|nr:DEAD H (Asp-Glu-Ala-Asp His) box helicase 11 [Blyttiomyces sp. JEL0837]